MDSSSNFQLKRSLGADNKVERKKAYKKLQGVITDNQVGSEEAWEAFGSLLFRGIEDESEGVREASLGALIQLRSLGSEQDWASFFLVLRREEPSEEVRLLRASLLAQLLQRDALLKVFAEDCHAALPSLLVDPYHQVRITACTLLRLTAGSSARSHLPLLLPPLCSNFTHVQKNVRQAALEALPELIVASDASEDDFGEVDISLAQRCFDPAPKVRQSLSTASAALLRDWRHNQRHHLRLMLLLLSQYEDDVQEVRDTSRALWKELAEVWIKKEIKSASDGEVLKDKMDFPKTLEHYPSDVIRPSFPCREYLSRHFHRILPATWMDLRDWRVETRVKTSQLLYVCFLHMEDRLTEHSVKILETIEHGVKDNEPGVVGNLEKASNYFGYFVDPKVWSPILIERLTSLDADSKTTLLRILSFILSGSDSSLLSFVLVDLGEVISQDEVTYTYKSEHLKCLLDCIEELVRMAGKSISIIQHQVFKALLVSIALSQSYETKERGRVILKKFANVIELPLEELFVLESGKLLEAYSANCEEWNESSFECLVFGSLLQESGSAMEHHIHAVFKIFHTVLDPSREHLHKLRLQFFMYLSKQISSAPNQDSNKLLLKNYSFKLIHEIICPALKWSSGKKAEAVRTASACALLSAFEAQVLSPEDILPLISTDLFPRMNSLLEDNSTKTRLFTLRTYKMIFRLGKNIFQAHQVVKILSFLIDRLNDKDNNIRLESLEAIGAADECLDPEVTASTYNKELEKYYASIALHMDDELPGVRKAVCDLLQKLSHRDPSLMETVLQNALSTHKHKDECSMVIRHIESLSI